MCFAMRLPLRSRPIFRDFIREQTMQNTSPDISGEVFLEWHFYRAV